MTRYALTAVIAALTGFLAALCLIRAEERRQHRSLGSLRHWED